jgi:hypothetical protein
MARSQKDDQFSPDESRKRMEAALRGARISGHKPMSQIAPKASWKKKPSPKSKEKRA